MNFLTKRSAKVHNYLTNSEALDTYKKLKYSVNLLENLDQEL